MSGIVFVFVDFAASKEFVISSLVNLITINLFCILSIKLISNITAKYFLMLSAS